MATFICSFLVLSLCDGGVLWIVVRFVLGTAMCGAYTVIESWLTAQTDPKAHGRVLSIYTVIVLASMALGQYLLNLTDSNPLHPFILVSLMVGLAIIPVSLTRSPAPAPVPATRFSFSKLYRRSHTAFAGALGSGLIMGSFWALGAVYVLGLTNDPSFVPWFIAANIVGGALAQYPIGVASDRIDRRHVLTFLCVACCGTALALSQATEQTTCSGARPLSVLQVIRCMPSHWPRLRTTQGPTSSSCWEAQRYCLMPWERQGAPWCLVSPYAGWATNRSLLRWGSQAYCLASLHHYSRGAKPPWLPKSKASLWVPHRRWHPLLCSKILDQVRPRQIQHPKITSLKILNRTQHLGVA